jgi:hypothetical protein
VIGMLKLEKVVTLRLPKQIITEVERQADKEQIKIATQLRRLIVEALKKGQ